MKSLARGLDRIIGRQERRVALYYGDKRKNKQKGTE
jgi:hypothetical protein